MGSPGHGHAAAPLELARFFGFSHDLLAILDGRGRVLLVSPSVERILGYDVDALLGLPLLSLVHPEDLDAVQERLRELPTLGSLSDLDGRLRRHDGQWVPMRWSLSAQDPSGHIYGVGRDRSIALRRQEEVRSREDAELRLRTARELHDGVLQTLTAASLQLEVARRLVRVDAEAAAEVLKKLGEAVTSEQRELRLYVDEMKMEEHLWADRTLPLGDRVANMLDRISAIWGVGTSLESDLHGPFEPELERQVLRVVQEGVVNAARHGGAVNVRVRLGEEGSTLSIALDDDGQGFPFQGEFTDQALRERRLGPVSLKRRVSQGGGEIFIRSTPSGAAIRIQLPSGAA